ncbi:MAG: hypothetical protein P8Z00_13660 [Anaerolineales bacterium]|jgi:hypothetical protein
MNNRYMKWMILTLILLGISLLLVGAAQSNENPWMLGWFEIPGGVGQSRSANFVLDGRAGLPVTDTSSGGDFKLGPDFGSVPQSTLMIPQLYFPLVVQ